jgi:hypothetical protein
MSKLSTRPNFIGTEIQDTDEFWINVDNGDSTFTSQKMSGLQLKDLLTGDELVQTVVLFDQNTPTTGGVVFTPNTPTTTGVLYISTTNNSTWKYNGTTYVTYTVTVTNTTPFNLSANSSIDAGGNKTASIIRSGNINVGISTEYVSVSSFTGVNHVSNSYSQIQATTYSDTLYPIIQTNRRRGTIASNSYVINGDILGVVSLNFSATIEAKATETHSAIARGTELIFYNRANGTTAPNEILKLRQDNKIDVSNSYTLPSTVPTTGQVMGNDEWLQLDTTATSGSVISFAIPQVYNSPASPSASNITNSLTGAKIGIVQKIYHNHTVAPTFPAGWVKMGTATYTTSTLNVIFAEWVSSTRVEYWITKPS